MLSVAIFRMPFEPKLRPAAWMSLKDKAIAGLCAKSHFKVSKSWPLWTTSVCDFKDAYPNADVASHQYRYVLSRAPEGQWRTHAAPGHGPPLKKDKTSHAVLCTAAACCLQLFSYTAFLFVLWRLFWRPSGLEKSGKALFKSRSRIMAIYNNRFHTKTNSKTSGGVGHVVVENLNLLLAQRVRLCQRDSESSLPRIQLSSFH
jgi:hypothetical protein